MVFSHRRQTSFISSWRCYGGEQISLASKLINFSYGSDEKIQCNRWGSTNKLENLVLCIRTQKSAVSSSLMRSSSIGILQFATKSSGGIAALWNTVSPRTVASWTSWTKFSFQTGSKVRCLMDVRFRRFWSTWRSTYGSRIGGASCQNLRCLSVALRPEASNISTFTVPVNIFFLFP